ncbi:hypothetical protein E2C01_035138 [Portunus trituberculatus]|uniref:Uncharacterized protein n=1 Tax=Portunus trituberculatus TaxID=210409 RepID=A0A5B7F8J0_PORTR|nr:hypothetical protein [Portunus trituberculatus]
MDKDEQLFSPASPFNSSRERIQKLAYGFGREHQPSLLEETSNQLQQKASLHISEHCTGSSWKRSEEALQVSYSTSDLQGEVSYKPDPTIFCLYAKTRATSSSASSLKEDILAGGVAIRLQSLPPRRQPLLITIRYDVVLVVAYPAGGEERTAGPEAAHDDDDRANDTHCCHAEGDDHCQPEKKEMGVLSLTRQLHRINTPVDS